MHAFLLPWKAPSTLNGEMLHASIKTGGCDSAFRLSSGCVLAAGRVPARRGSPAPLPSPSLQLLERGGARLALLAAVLRTLRALARPVCTTAPMRPPPARAASDCDLKEPQVAQQVRPVFAGQSIQVAVERGQPRNDAVFIAALPLVTRHTQQKQQGRAAWRAKHRHHTVSCALLLRPSHG